MLYGRRGEEIHKMLPFDITVKSTLGASDTFKAGCVYALLNGLSDTETVRFASACSAVAILKLERVVWFLMESVKCFQQKTIGNMKRSVLFGMNFPKNMEEKSLGV